MRLLSLVSATSSIKFFIAIRTLPDAVIPAATVIVFLISAYLYMLESLENEKAALNANSELITSMSHDIRTPLTVLIGYLDIMKMYSKDEVMMEYIKSSEKTAMRLKKLSDDMFKYLLVFGNSAKPAELEEYDGMMLIEQMLSEHVLLLREHGYEVKFDMPSESGVKVLTNAPDLMRIIDNVFSNIGKYADREKPIEIKVEIGGDRVSMTFTNAISADASMAESNKIGLKTCAKIAELISSEFSYSVSDDVFTVTVGLISHRE